MKLAIIGLGRMGANMARRLIRGGHEVVAFDQNSDAISAIEKEGAIGARSLEDLQAALGRPAICWLMLPAGKATEDTVKQFYAILSQGDILVDGGNSYFKDDVRRADFLSTRGVLYLDVGTSGGIWGLERGYSLMIGGDHSAAEKLEPIFKTLAPSDQGYLYCGPAGAGHFVKMVHNGIEYGMMQALAEGFDILKHANIPYKFDLREISEVWRKGSVVSSWLLDLIAVALNRDPTLGSYEGRVPDSGEGRWAVQTAIEEGVSAHVISAALYTRFRSREQESFAEKLLSAMRKEFGGHRESAAEKKAS